MTKLHLTLALILFLGTSFNLRSQSDSAITLIQSSDKLYREGKYLESGRAFESGITLLGKEVNWYYRYNAMCSWALANRIDTAFMYLEVLAGDSSYTEYNHLIKDPDLVSMHEDPRWDPLTKQVKAIKEFKEKDYDQELIAWLATLREEDQKWRNMNREWVNGNLDSNEFSQEEIIQNMRAADSSSHLAIIQIIEEYGYPGFNIVGEEGSGNFWLLVQHQDNHPETQRKVLALMKVEVEKDNADKQDFAYLTDRVAVNADEPQVYGTQMRLNPDKTSFIPKKVMDRDGLNERRASIGMGTIEEYIELMNTQYPGALTGNKGND